MTPASNRRNTQELVEAVKHGIPRSPAWANALDALDELAERLEAAEGDTVHTAGLINRMKRAEALNRELVEALEEIASGRIEIQGDNWAAGMLDGSQRIAHEALAKAKETETWRSGLWRNTSGV